MEAWGRQVIPDAAVEAALYACGFSSQSVDERRELLVRALEAAAPHMLADVEWAVFRSQGGPNESPAENLRYKTREAAQASIDNGYSQPQYWEPRGRMVGAWAK
ncbi:hypothetical protein [Arthrobacter sp. ES3-54]|uniref:hypothetical protein n=1 Tax=Arthrobacter sp. ES3-54 TaxID=1502991 RepID=UPI0024053EAF|nr:hypothetical protein [Arthrobacter sp. ES3-54]MDF9748608.1 hypothetical protein [Arthrobacter sp. ES3-54]